MKRRLLNAAVWLGIAVCCFLLVGALVQSSYATWRPEYAQIPQEVQDWYKNAELTPEAQKRFPWKKCCDHADVFKTKFKVNKVDGTDEWYYERDGVYKRVPSDIIHWGESAPGGQPTLFIYNEQETCFFPGEGNG